MENKQVSTTQAAAKEPLIGYVHSIETFGSVDGPGIRYVAFLKDATCVANTVTTLILGNSTLAIK